MSASLDYLTTAANIRCQPRGARHDPDSSLARWWRITSRQRNRATARSPSETHDRQRARPPDRRARGKLPCGARASFVHQIL